MMKNLSAVLLLSVISLFGHGFTMVKASDEAGLAFLAANREKEGVVELPSGLQYKILRNGTGIYHPAKDTPCKCHYRGTLITGKQFDASYDRGEPTTFAPNQVIAGWTEAMQLMVEGDHWELTIPSELAYGDQDSGPIPAKSVLVFTLELIEITIKAPGHVVLALKCEVANPDESRCSPQEMEYITKTLSGWTDEKKKSELERLTKIASDASATGRMKPELAQWMQRRMHLLKQVAPADEAKKEL